MEAGMKRFGVMLMVAALSAVASLMVVFVLGSPATAASGCSTPAFGPGSSYHPKISPHVSNPWMPLIGGTTYVYSGVKDKMKALDVVTVSKRTRKVDRVVTRIVHDRLFVNNKLSERTTDYYAQDKCGNVWYFGEDTAELDSRGRVIDTSGSFHAGISGAEPGVFMQAKPQLGRRFRQEWFPGQAADQFRAVSRSATATSPFGTFHNALRTEERTALEPGVLDNKYYVKGIGEVIETAVKGPVETLRLVDVLR
jgi:hypothetical protein